MNAGQMVHDVREYLGNRLPVRFLGRMGGTIPMPEEVENEVRMLLAREEVPAFTPEGGNGHLN